VTRACQYVAAYGPQLQEELAFFTERPCIPGTTLRHFFNIVCVVIRGGRKTGLEHAGHTQGEAGTAAIVGKAAAGMEERVTGAIV
jgi:hypothetical protein